MIKIRYHKIILDFTKVFELIINIIRYLLSHVILLAKPNSQNSLNLSNSSYGLLCFLCTMLKEFIVVKISFWHPSL